MSRSQTDVDILCVCAVQQRARYWLWLTKVKEPKGDRQVYSEYTHAKFRDQNIGDTTENSDEIERIPFIAKIILASEKDGIDVPVNAVTYPQTKCNYFQNTFYGE